MGRHLNRNQSTLQFDKYYRGCIWGLFPLQLHSFKKLMPQIRHKYERPSKSGLKTQSRESDEGQVSEVGNSDSIYTTIGNTAENISTHAFKEDTSCKGKVLQQPRLRRTYSIHHLEPPSNYLEILNVNHKVPVEVGELEDGQVAWNSKHFGEQDVLDLAAVDNYQYSCQSEASSEAYEDFFDAFQIDKKLFMKNTQKLDANDSDPCQGELKYHRNVTLRRSGSFPTADKSCSRYGSLAPSKLESKLTDVWPSSSSVSWSSSSSSSSSFCRLENMLPRSQSMVCKLPIDVIGELITEKSAQDGSDHGTSDYASDVRKYKLSRIRRASSLNESLERYTQLFETGFRRDAKFNISKSLRLSNEDEAGLNLSDSKFLRKAHSLREATLHIERSDSIEFAKVPYKSEPPGTEGYHLEQSDAVVSDDESGTFTPSILETGTGLMMSNASEECISAILDLEFNQGHHPINEDDINTEGENTYHLDKKIDLSRKELDEVPAHSSYSEPECVRNEDGSPDVQFRLLDDLQTKSVYDPSSDFSQQDDAMGNADTSTQNALNQLVVLRTNHSSMHISTELYSDIDEQQLLSNLINEAVLNVYNGCDAYWPKPLCLNCHMHPTPPTEHHATQKVQSRIQKLQSLSLKNSNTMDSIIAYDLANNDGWMHLQADAESLALALDEIIFDELIEELVCE